MPYQKIKIIRTDSRDVISENHIKYFYTFFAIFKHKDTKIFKLYEKHGHNVSK